MTEVDPKEYEVNFFKEEGFIRKKCKIGGEYFWTLNESLDTCQDAPCVEYWFDKISSIRNLSVSDSRKIFLMFFKKRGHEVLRPRPVVARWREDLYLTIASIVVFQPHVTSGIVPPPANPLVISQPSIRLEDIDNVGLTIGRHLTTFEMAAHHAFNYPNKRIYWKDETVRYAFEFFTKELRIPKDLIVFKESWWEGGGNAGPCFEVAVGGLELATLVFMQYSIEGKEYRPLPLKIVDTGYGIERISWFTKKTPTAFHAIYGNLLERFRNIIGLERPEEEILWAAFRAAGRLDPESPESIVNYYRKVAEIGNYELKYVKDVLSSEAKLYSVLDHTKTIALMLADGIVPSNSGEGYLARLVIRRALRQLSLLGFDGDLADLVDLQIGYWADNFKQLKEQRNYIIEAVILESKKFRELLRKGRKEIRKLVKMKGSLDVEDLVRLYDSKGLPPEIVAEESRKFNVEVDIPHNFYSLVASRHKAPARLKTVGKVVKLPEDIKKWASQFRLTELLFHKDPYLRKFTAKVLGIKDRYLVLDSTAFYPKGGGQDYDKGYIMINGRRILVNEVYKIDGVVVHVLETPIDIPKGLNVIGVIDWYRRFKLMRHHTATHIILGAARRVLGRHIWQAGAEKSEEKGRLDITHHKPLNKDDLRKIEELANMVIDDRREVRTYIINRNEAEDKYGFSLYQGGVPMEPRLRIVEIKNWDVEACFGTHVRNTAEVGSIKIIKSERIQDGVVRLEFVAGPRVAEVLTNAENRLDALAKELGASHGHELKRVQSLKRRLDSMEKIVEEYRRLWIRTLKKNALKVGAFSLVIFEPLEHTSEAIQEVLRQLTKEDNVVAIAVIKENQKTRFEIALGQGILSKINVNRIVEKIKEEIGGKGGGKGGRASILIPRIISNDKARDLFVNILKEI